MINQNCKTSCGLIQGGWSPAGSSDVFSILGCMTSSLLVLVLFHFVFYCSCLRRTDTIVFAKLNNPPSLKSPPPSSNAFEINTCKPPGGDSISVRILLQLTLSVHISDTTLCSSLSRSFCIRKKNCNLSRALANLQGRLKENDAWLPVDIKTTRAF